MPFQPANLGKGKRHRVNTRKREKWNLFRRYQNEVDPFLKSKYTHWHQILGKIATSLLPSNFKSFSNFAGVSYER